MVDLTQTLKVHFREQQIILFLFFYFTYCLLVDCFPPLDYEL